MVNITHIRTGLNMFRHSLAVKSKGIRRYEGNADKICRQIIKDRWNGTYFETSANHYNYFWTRDFGMTIDSLLKLGYRKEVMSTLEFALEAFAENNSIATAIYRNGRPFNFPNAYSPDSVALFFRSLRAAKAKHLVEKYNDFLNEEIQRFYDSVLDEDTGLVKRNAHFSGMRDYVIRDSSCYDNIMAALLAEECRNLKLDNPFKRLDFRKSIKENFWTGFYFLDDLSGSRHVASDANVFPFWTGIFDETKMLKSSLTAMQGVALDRPFPLKYIPSNVKQKKISFRMFVPGWEDDKVWTLIGPLYISLASRIDKEKAKSYAELYRQVIEMHGNYLELFYSKGEPYKSMFYHSAQGMLWCANYLTL